MTDAKTTGSAQPAAAPGKVFISYSRTDLAAAQRLEATLSGAFDVFLDVKGILPGDNWRERLRASIQRVDAVIFLISPRSAASRVCRWEISEAERHRKSILPALVTPTPANAIPGRLSRL